VAKGGVNKGGGNPNHDPKTGQFCSGDCTDWKKISEWETVKSEPTLTAYIPMKDKKPIEKSGVTVATGVDLGRQNVDDLKKYGLSKDLADKLRPYQGQRGDNAMALINQNPLVLTDKEANERDAAVKQKESYEIQTNYDKSVVEANKEDIKISGSPKRKRDKFLNLPSVAQTILMSTGHHMGAYYPKKGPHHKSLWQNMVDQNYDGAVNDLRALAGDTKDGGIINRHNNEADYLNEYLGTNN
jgi:hypothetical protein